MSIELEDYFVKLTFGRTFSRTLIIWWDNLALYFGISLLFYVPYLLFILAIPSFRNALRADDPLKSDYFGMNMVLLYTMEFAFSLFVGIAGQASIAYSVVSYYAGRGRPQWWKCIKQGGYVFCDLFGATLIVAFGVAIVGTFLAATIVFLNMLLGDHLSTRVLEAAIIALTVLPIFCYCLVPLALVSPSFVIEHAGPLDGIRHVWKISHNHRSYIFGTSFVLGLFNLICSGYVGVFFKGYLGVILSNMPFLVYYPIKAILVTIVYLNIRIEKDQLNRTSLREKVGIADADDLNPNEFPYTLLGNDDNSKGYHHPLDDAFADTVLEFDLEQSNGESVRSSSLL
jgi:hypothetical protein